MEKFLVACLCLFWLCVAHAALNMKDLKRHNELETKEEKVEEIMHHVAMHCQAINTTEGGRWRRAAVDDELRDYLMQEINSCDEEVSGLNPTQPPTQLPIDGPCTSSETVNLTGAWRKDDLGSMLKPANGFIACDRALQTAQHWFRFTGSAGVQLADSCRPAYSCGGHGGFWSNAPMPVNVGEIRRVPIYGSWNGNCKWYTWPQQNSMLVQRCSLRPGDFIYRVQGTGSCYWTFCGMDLSPSNHMIH